MDYNYIQETVISSASDSRELEKSSDSGPPGEISRRDFLITAGLCTAGGILAACSSSRTSSKTRIKNQIQLVYQDWRTEWFPRMVKEVLDQFHETHPNIHVYYSLDPPSDSFNETMIEIFEAATAPDVFQGCCSYFPIWAQQGYTLDLKPYVSNLESGSIEDWDPVQYKALSTSEGV